MSPRSVVVAGAVLAAVLVACGGQEPPPRPPPPAPAPHDPPWLATAAASCAKVVSCMQSSDAPPLRDAGACVDGWIARADAQGHHPLERCLAEAKTCARVVACVHGAGDARAADFCAQRPGVVSACDGERLVSCGDDASPEGSVVDCAQIGGSCREAKAAGGLVIRACFSPTACPAGAPEARCDGNAVVSCRDGAVERVTCKPGTRCAERHDEGEATAVCMPLGGRLCDRLGGRRCEDGRLVECERGATSAEPRVSDCAGLGLRCAGSGPRAACWVPSDVECGSELLPRCEGARLVFCAAGRVTKIACASLGLGPCNPGARGPMAACEDVTK